MCRVPLAPGVLVTLLGLAGVAELQAKFLVEGPLRTRHDCLVTHPLPHVQVGNVFLDRTSVEGFAA